MTHINICFWILLQRNSVKSEFSHTSAHRNKTSQPIFKNDGLLELAQIDETCKHQIIHKDQHLTP